VKGIVFALILGMASFAYSQSSDVLGAHDLSNGSSQLRGNLSAACLYCHAPHSGVSKGPLWSQQLSTEVYPQLYQSDTMQNTQVQPAVGADSSLCLSCHDGTVAPGQTVPYGSIQMSKTMSTGLVPNLAASHPFSLKLPLKDAANLVPSLASSGMTADATQTVKLIKGNLECGSCHEPHNQRIDKRSTNFLVKDNSNGSLCLACHTVNARTVNTINNPLAQWTNNAHARSNAVVNSSAGWGGYNTVAEFACIACHVPHNAGAEKGLLRTSTTLLPNLDPVSQNCATCHGGGTVLLQPLLNVVDVMGTKGHPYATDTNPHTGGESVVPDQNRHASCADCHNGHAAQPTTTFNVPPGVRPSQNGVSGVAADGTLLPGSAANQYETCLRCHGYSTGKQILSSVYGYLPLRGATGADQLNLIYQFGTTALSKHPVMTDAKLANQPSLRTGILSIGGSTQARVMGSRLFCSDCHNSDNNREFGGNGPNGPHGSTYDHILERPYLISQVAPSAAPGTDIINLVTNLQPGDARLQPGSNGPFELCAKCHNLNSIMSDQSFAHHSNHLQDGFSCSVCHSAHGVPSGNANFTGERLINFDMTVVGPFKGTVSYVRGSCTLTCHGRDHDHLK
jgi:predicted CXXCH cytochrome family protein